MINKFQKILLINKSTLIRQFDKSIFENIAWSYSYFHNHHDVIIALQSKNPYTITVLLENLKYKYRNRKEYVKKTKIPTISKYRELLFKAFFQEYGEEEGNRVYGQWLGKYRPSWGKEKKFNTIDDYIIEQEFEPRYKEKILSRFKNQQSLFKEGFRIERDRYYNLPEPLNNVDWRNPYDNTFVWEENGKRVARRGGSGSSGSRETNSIFILGLLELNKTKPVPSYMFLYSEENKLFFIRKFESICVPIYDIGSNYHQVTNEEIGKIKQGGIFFNWNGISKIQSISMESSKVL